MEETKKEKQAPSPAETKPLLGPGSALLEALNQMGKSPSPKSSAAVHIEQITVNITLPALKVSTPKKRIEYGNLDTRRDRRRSLYRLGY